MQSGWLTDRPRRKRGINSHSEGTCAESGPCWPGGLGRGWTGLDWAGGGCQSALTQSGRLAPGVILASCWCDQHGHQSKTVAPEASEASLAMLTNVDIRIVGGDSLEPVAAAGALTGGTGLTHPVILPLKITPACSRWPHHGVSGGAVPSLTVAVRRRA